jgi:hypothetical protein
LGKLQAQLYFCGSHKAAGPTPMSLASSDPPAGPDLDGERRSPVASTPYRGSLTTRA